ncbi:EpsG family protein [Fusobacterium ulcerans]
MIIGLQFGVGTDYFNYLRIYNNPNYLELYFRKKEYIFYFYIKFIKFFFIEGQSFFIITSFLENLIFYIYLKTLLKNKIINLKKLWIFIFLFLCFGTTFYNQTNGIRQYFNIYLLIIMSVFIINKNFLYYNIIFFIGLNIHRSFLFLYPLYFINFIIKKINKKTFIIFIILVLILNFLPIVKVIKEIIKFVPRYKHYVYYDYFSEITLKNKITKMIFVPFYLESAKLIDNIKNEKKALILRWGIFGFIIRIFCLKITVLNRIGEYFVLLSLFPIYFLIENYIEKNSKFKLFILFFMILGLFVTKTIIFPKGEYLYNSYLFN